MIYNIGIKIASLNNCFHSKVCKYNIYMHILLSFYYYGNGKDIPQMKELRLRQELTVRLNIYKLLWAFAAVQWRFLIKAYWRDRVHFSLQKPHKQTVMYLFLAGVLELEENHHDWWINKNKAQKCNDSKKKISLCFY